MLWKRLANSVNAWCWLSDSGESAESKDGFWSACMRSFAAAMDASVDVAVGILTEVGNHASVSAMRSALVSVAYTR